MASSTRPSEDQSGGETDGSLLGADDAPPVAIVNPGGTSPFLLIGDHAGNEIPSRLGTLGLSERDRSRHIAWDIGIAELGVILASTLDAAFVRQTYSRLVVDCNRAPHAHDAIAPISDATPIRGNQKLNDASRAARYTEIHEPYHAAIAAELARRDAAGASTVLVALHSFTPKMGSDERPWQIGILHDGGDPGFALDCLTTLRSRSNLVVGDNEPYRMDQVDYTIPRHAYPSMRPYVEVEVRQDLLQAQDGPSHWVSILADVLVASLSGPSSVRV